MPGGNDSSLISSSFSLTSSMTSAALEPGALLENDGRRGMAVDVRVNIEERGAQLDFGDVLEPQDLTLGICL